MGLQDGAIICPVIDLHCHVLPGIDDGPQTTDAALELALTALEAGTTTMVATPHVSWDWPDNDAELIARHVARMNAALHDAAIDVEILAGAEVAMTRAADLDDDELTALHLGGGPYLLVECPYSPAASGFEGLTTALLDRGHRIVLAHPERCPAFQRDRTALERIVANGVLSSITAGSLAGRFGRDVRRFAHELVRDGLVHNVASDAHDTIRRPPGTAADLEAEGLGALADWLTREVPEAVLDGTPVPKAPILPPAERQGLFGRLRRA